MTAANQSMKFNNINKTNEYSCREDKDIYKK